MKTAVSQPQKRAKAGIFQMPSMEPFQGKGRVHATSIVLKNTTDRKRQHVAIGKLVQMCRESDVVTAVNRGITAEVRRDRIRVMTELVVIDASVLLASGVQRWIP